MNEPEANDQEMSVWEHLEELRWVVVRAVIGIVVGMILCAIFFDEIAKYVILLPTTRTNPPMKLLNTEVYGQLSVWMQIVLWGGVILSFPYTIMQIWKFVQPGLKAREKKYVRQISFFTVFSFVCGMAFAYWVMLPMVLEFFNGLRDRQCRKYDFNRKISQRVSRNHFAFRDCVRAPAGSVFSWAVGNFNSGLFAALPPAFYRNFTCGRGALIARREPIIADRFVCTTLGVV